MVRRQQLGIDRCVERVLQKYDVPIAEPGDDTTRVIRRRLAYLARLTQNYWIDRLKVRGRCRHIRDAEPRDVDWNWWAADSSVSIIE